MGEAGIHLGHQTLIHIEGQYSVDGRCFEEVEGNMSSGANREPWSCEAAKLQYITACES